LPIGKFSEETQKLETRISSTSEDVIEGKHLGHQRINKFLIYFGVPLVIEFEKTAEKGYKSIFARSIKNINRSERIGRS
jgi:hypothetical protein